jgi:hypothetical protein
MATRDSNAEAPEGRAYEAPAIEERAEIGRPLIGMTVKE